MQNYKEIHCHLHLKISFSYCFIKIIYALKYLLGDGFDIV